MPIVFDASSQGGGNTVSSLTVAHTIGAVATQPRMLVVGLITHCSTAVFVNYVRYNGVDMNYLNFVTANGGLLLTQLWCLPEASLPAAGAYNITAGFDRTIDRGCMLFGTSWYGMVQTDPTPVNTNSADAVTSLNNTYTSTAINSRIIQVHGTSLQQTPSASGTDNQQVVSGNQATLIGGGIFRVSSPIVGSKTFGCAVASSASIVSIYAEFIPADYNAMMRDNIFERGMARGFNRGSYRP
jgi:hypothetical protein